MVGKTHTAQLTAIQEVLRLILPLIPDEDTRQKCQDLLEQEGRAMPTIPLEQILVATAKVFGITAAYMHRPDKERYAADARKVFAIVAREQGYEWHEIGDAVWRTHSAMLQQAQEGQNLIAYDEDLKCKLDAVKAAIICNNS